MSYSYAAPSRSYSYPQAPPGFPQLPFNGPPPKPPNIRVNPQDWQNGNWAMNPHFNSSQWSVGSTQSNQAWIPSQAWHQQRQQEWQAQQQQMAAAASYNPYKRVPRPPSAEYLATKLSDNPLGLSNMIPRNEYFASHGGVPPPPEPGVLAATPWVWNPRGLDDDDDDEGTQEGSSANTRRGPDTNTRQGSSANTRQGSSSNNRRPEPPPPASAPPHGGGYAGNAPPPMYARQSQPREMTDPPPQSQRRNSAPTRHSSEPPRSSSTDTLPAMDRPLDRPRQYQRDSHQSQSENFTSSDRQLQPTFSSNIVRTPQHYKARSSSAGPSPQQPIYAPSRGSMDSQRGGSIDAQLSSRMEGLTTQTNGLSRHSSMPVPLSSGPPASSSMSGVSSFVDEPSSMLSPLLGVVPPTNPPNPKHSTRALGRHSSVPVVSASTSLNTIPEGSGDSTRRSTHRDHTQRRSRHTSPVAPSRGPVLTHSRHTSPSSSGPPLTPSRANPLPDPPKELARNPGITLPVQRTPPSNYRNKLRKGLWNRRGDHLTVDGFVVYAPVHLANPQELRDYPAETVGYRDHLGAQVGYLESRPELPESLPRFGQPPRMPYEKFIVYEYFQ